MGPGITMNDQSATRHPAIIGDVVFGGAQSSVAVCTLASRRLLPWLAGRPEIAIAGRVFTENIGIERMVQNLVADSRYRYLIVCGRESGHKVGQTILALHQHGLDAAGRVIGSEAPEPFLPNLTPDQLHAFQSQIALVDMIGTDDPEAIVARAGQLTREPAAADAGERRPAPAMSSRHEPATIPDSIETVVATPDPPESWSYDPVGFFLIFVDRARKRLRVEQYSRDRRLQRVFDGRNAQELCHTIVRRGQVTLMDHAAYLGRELAKAEAALQHGLEYNQDLPLRPAQPTGHDRPPGRSSP